MNYIVELLFDPVTWAALLSLIVMEVVLGIDNLIFVAVLTSKLPKEIRARARTIGIGAALVLRLCLLGMVVYVVKLTTPVIELFDLALSWRDMILIAGGLFLVWKATREIHHLVDPNPAPTIYDSGSEYSSAAQAILQILVLDLVFSVDSIITAVGMTTHVPIMFVAVIVAVGLMLMAASPLAEFIQKNPTIVMLALGFLLLIGTTLIADGFGVHVPRGYVYAAMAFAGAIEGLNMLSRRARPVHPVTNGTDAPSPGSGNGAN